MLIHYQYNYDIINKIKFFIAYVLVISLSRNHFAAPGQAARLSTGRENPMSGFDVNTELERFSLGAGKGLRRRSGWQSKKHATGSAAC